MLLILAPNPILNEGQAESSPVKIPRKRPIDLSNQEKMTAAHKLTKRETGSVDGTADSKFGGRLVMLEQTIAAMELQHKEAWRSMVTRIEKVECEVENLRLFAQDNRRQITYNSIVIEGLQGDVNSLLSDANMSPTHGATSRAIWERGFSPIYPSVDWTDNE